MIINKMSCCNIAEVAAVGYGEKSGQKLLSEFCKQIATSQYDYAYGGVRSTDKLGYIYCVYVWSGVVNRGGGASTSRFSGEALADYINSNKLGVVHVSEKTENLAFHQRSIVKGYMYIPDPAKLRAWWKENYKGEVSK